MQQKRQVRPTHFGITCLFFKLQTIDSSKSLFRCRMDVSCLYSISDYNRFYSDFFEFFSDRVLFPYSYSRHYSIHVVDFVRFSVLFVAYHISGNGNHFCRGENLTAFFQYALDHQRSERRLFFLCDRIVHFDNRNLSRSRIQIIDWVRKEICSFASNQASSYDHCIDSALFFTA